MDNNQIIQLTTSILDDGHSAEIPAFGISMFPTLLPGDHLLIEPTQKLDIGDIVVFRGQDILIAHRLIKITEDEYICLGDSLFTPDLPIKKTDILGKVVRRNRNGRTQTIDSLRFKLTKSIMPKIGKYPRIMIRYCALAYVKLKKV